MALVGELLEGELIEAVRVLRLEVDDAQAVRLCAFECDGWMAVGDAACKLIGDHEAEPDCELPPETPPPMRQVTPPYCDHGRHPGRILTGPFGQAKSDRKGHRRQPFPGRSDRGCR